MKIKDVLVMAAIGLLGAACSDDDNKGSQWGDGVGGTKTNLDVSAYDKWTYVNLKTGETEIHPDTSEWIYTDGSVSEPKAKETSRQCTFADAGEFPAAKKTLVHGVLLPELE